MPRSLKLASYLLLDLIFCILSTFMCVNCVPSSNIVGVCVCVVTVPIIVGQHRRFAVYIMRYEQCHVLWNLYFFCSRIFRLDLLFLVNHTHIHSSCSTEKNCTLKVFAIYIMNWIPIRNNICDPHNHLLIETIISYN